MRQEEEDYCPAGFWGIGQSLVGFVASPNISVNSPSNGQFPSMPDPGQ